MTSNSRASFASDYDAGVIPDVLQAIAAANDGFVGGYGDDPHTQLFADLIQMNFGETARGFIVLTGTGANIVAVRSILRPWEGVICAKTAHLNVHEGGAPEGVGGIKLLPVATEDGKLTPELIASRLTEIGDEHVIQPRVVSISQVTELGTVYSRTELLALSAYSHANGLLMHMDGARLVYAAASLEASLQEITADVGIDVLSFGGTKAGLFGAEAVISFRPELSNVLAYARKGAMQLPSKMRFVSAQFNTLLSDQRWLSIANHCNLMASVLADEVSDAPGLAITQRVQSNAVFARIPPDAIDSLRSRWEFHVWDSNESVVRWMCSWLTTADDVRAFAVDIRAACVANGK